MDRLACIETDHQSLRPAVIEEKEAICSQLRASLRDERGHLKLVTWSPLTSS